MFTRTKKVKEWLADLLGKQKYPELLDLIGELKTKLAGINSDEEQATRLEDRIFELKKELSDLSLTKSTELSELQITKSEEIAEIKLKRDISERDIKHLVKIKEERMAVESQKAELDIKSEYKDLELALQKEYFEKSTAQLDLARKEMKEVYDKIMTCMPNVNLDVQRDTSTIKKK